MDNLSTPKPPDYVPPFTIFAPWCFRSLQMQPEETFQRGRLYALRLLCMATGKETADEKKCKQKIFKCVFTSFFLT